MLVMYIRNGTEIMKYHTPGGNQKLVHYCTALRVASWEQCKLVQSTGNHHFLFSYLQVPLKAIQGKLYTRVSAHLHNVIEDYEKLADAVLEMTEDRTLDKILKVKK